MQTVAGRVSDLLAANGVVVESVSIGRLDDKATWRVRPVSQQTAAQPFIDSFAMPTAGQLVDEEAAHEVGRKELRAIAEALWECIPNPTMTKAQLRARAIALFKSL